MLPIETFIYDNFERAKCLQKIDTYITHHNVSFFSG